MQQVLRMINLKYADGNVAVTIRNKLVEQPAKNGTLEGILYNKYSDKLGKYTIADVFQSFLCFENDKEDIESEGGFSQVSADKG